MVIGKGEHQAARGRAVQRQHRMPARRPVNRVTDTPPARADERGEVLPPERRPACHHHHVAPAISFC